MPYLIPNDFIKSIQVQNLNQVIGSNYTIIDSWLLAAQEKAKSYLVQKYLIDDELTETSKWDKTKVYEAANRVYLDAPVFSATATYAIGDTVTYQSNYYTAIAIIPPGVFDATKFSTPIAQYTLYYGAYPSPLFNVNNRYNVGDLVYWEGKKYTALQPSAFPNNDYVLQYGSIQNIPQQNYFPGSPNQGQWDAGIVYNIPANIDILNTTYWTEGDNRGQQMVQTIINLVLYYAHARISPMAIPTHIKENYNESVDWLKEAGDGMVTPNLQKVQPNSGFRIRYGGDIRLSARY